MYVCLYVYMYVSIYICMYICRSMQLYIHSIMVLFWTVI